MNNPPGALSAHERTGRDTKSERREVEREAEIKERRERRGKDRKRERRVLRNIYFLCLEKERERERARSIGV